VIRIDPHETFVAITSPPGPGARGIVRVSGPEAPAVSLAGFRPDRPGPWPDRAALRSGSLSIKGLRPSLPATIVLWPGRRTYTGQPLAEIHTVGSPPLLDLVLAHCLARGARPAEPGEFTLRAFLNGRIDLTRAEAVLGVIDARNPAQLGAALAQLAGGLATPIEALRDHLLDVLAHLEAGLDFVEEADVDPIGRAALAADLVAAAEAVADLGDRLRGRDRPDGSPRVVLAGPPNAGKSRLFNALIGGEAALVSERAGTTRDYLVAPSHCDGLLVDLVEPAGLEVADDPIGHQAQTRRSEQVARADLRLDCWPVDAGPEPEPPDDRPRLLVRTKADLATNVAGAGLATSAATGLGLDRLRLAIADTLRAGDGDAPTSTSARCRDGLARAAISLRDAAATLQHGVGDELVAIDLRQSVDELGIVVGADVGDDILDRIFRRFCIGK
jgi:tRNA modification GTPase